MSRKHTEAERAEAKIRTREYQRRWQEKNRSKVIAATRRWRQRHPAKAKESARRANLKQWYGVTPEWFAATLLAQKGCAICKTTEVSGRGGWATDHNHATKKVRGVLCGHCNRALGLLNDAASVCDKAAQYLRAYGGADDVS